VSAARFPFSSSQRRAGTRFGKLYAVVDIHSDSTEAVLNEALEWMDLAQRQCGECSAPLDWD
jgi:hypothetical protein